MKSHVNIMDSDTAYENVIVYHGSDHILKEPIYQGGKTDNDYGNGFYTTEYKDRAKSWAVLNGDPEELLQQQTDSAYGLLPCIRPPFRRYQFFLISHNVLL